MKIVLQHLTKRFPARSRKSRGEVTAVNDCGAFRPVRLRQEHDAKFNLRPARPDGG